MKSKIKYSELTVNERLLHFISQADYNISENDFIDLIKRAKHYHKNIYCDWCGHRLVYHVFVRHRGVRYKCARCRKLFTIQKGTFLQSTNINHTKWVKIIKMYEMGWSTHKVGRVVGITQKTSWNIKKVIDEIKNGYRKRNGGVV